jgi:hypothetical protein
MIFPFILIFYLVNQNLVLVNIILSFVDENLYFVKK